jgi:hypothetical protein
MMFDAIQRGRKPTEVFKELLLGQVLNNSELASRFDDYFENVNSEAIEVIWHWQRPGGRPGLTDEEVDATLLKLLREAGYLGGDSE